MTRILPLLFASALAVLPQGSGAPPVFTAKAELVVLHATVTDRHGGYVSDLPRESFTLTENGVARPIELFTAVDTPVTAGLLVDSSGSMFGVRDAVAAAAAAFAASSNPDDELFALTFNEYLRESLPASAPFTADPALLARALETSISARGRTALHDAIDAGLQYAARGTHARKVLVIVSDGGDNASLLMFDEIVRRAEAANTVIYTVAIEDRVGDDARPERLERLAKASGGLAFRPSRVTEVREVLLRIARDIRSSYTIGFAPPSGAAAFHPVTLAAHDRDGRALRVRTRSGYLAGSGE